MKEEKKEDTKEVIKADDYKVALTAKASSGGGLIPQTFDQLWRLAQVMAASGLMPKGLQSIQAVFVAVQMGLEIGLSPMQAVQNIAVINGRPSIWGDAGLGLIRGSGLLEEFKEWHEGEGENLTYFCQVKRKDEADLAVGQFSMADAKTAGLIPADPFSPWTKYPKRMLQWRARSWPLRDKFTDVLKGLRLAEEIMDLKELPNGTFGSVSTKEIEAGTTFEEATQPLDPTELIKQFDASIPDKTHMGYLKTYLKMSSDTFEKSVDEIKAEAAKDLDGFWTQFNNWATQQASGKTEEGQEKDPTRKQYIGLRKGDGVKTGLKPWVMAHLEYIPKLEQKYQDEIREKWVGFYPDELYPLDKQPPTQEDSLGEEHVEGTKDAETEDEALVPCTRRDGDMIKPDFCKNACPDSKDCADYKNYLDNLEQSQVD